MITEAELAQMWRRSHANRSSPRRLERSSRDRKGVLFDPWVVVTHSGVQPSDRTECFAAYRPSGWTVARASRNLEAKLRTKDFDSDVEQLSPG